jgi:hypothetical protein
MSSWRMRIVSEAGGADWLHRVFLDRYTWQDDPLDHTRVSSIAGVSDLHTSCLYCTAAEVKSFMTRRIGRRRR